MNIIQFVVVVVLRVAKREKKRRGSENIVVSLSTRNTYEFIQSHIRATSINCCLNKREKKEKLVTAIGQPFLSIVQSADVDRLKAEEKKKEKQTRILCWDTKGDGQRW